MSRNIVRHSGARTRALYRWETEVIFLDKRNTRFDMKACERFAADFWRYEGRVAERCPRIKLTMHGDYSYCLGRSDIIIHIQESGPVILIHELVHAKGFGSGKSMHPVSFVRDYLRCLARFVSFNFNEIEESAMMRGLL